MPRFVTLVLGCVHFAAPVSAQVSHSPARTPSQAGDEQKPERSFDIIDEAPDTGGSSRKGSRIIAGTEVMANTSIGFGVFGEKANPPDHAKSIYRDYSVPKSRKAAFGVALRF